MRADLGSWSRPQARAVEEVLREAGLDPTLEPAEDGLRVSVPAEQSERAHRALAAEMTRVARASGRASEPDDEQPPLVLERMREWGGWLAVLVVVMFVAVETPGPWRLPAGLLALSAVFLARWWWRRDAGDRGPYGPGA